MKGSFFLIFFVLATISSGELGTAQGFDSRLEGLVDKFAAIEGHSDIENLERFFSEDMVFWPEKGPPICGRKAVVELYGIFFQKFDYKPVYKILETKTFGENLVVMGTCQSSRFSKRGALLVKQHLYFEMHFKKEDNQHKLQKFFLSDVKGAEKTVPSLPKPSGKYSVGKRDFFYLDDSRSDLLAKENAVARPVGFQVWYPCLKNGKAVVANYRSKSSIEAIAAYLGWPLFNLSYQQLVKTNSFQDAAIHPNDEPYPVILYNHGYGGFPAVHQVLFEELASHGFVVASVGHVYESAMLTKSNGDLLTFRRNNAVVAAVNNESYSAQVEDVKHQVVHADNEEEKYDAYKKLISISLYNNQSVREWCRDSQFVLNKLRQLNNEYFRRMLDLNLVGVAGHSLGGATAGQLALVEPRVRAGINFDGFQFGDLLKQGLEKPFMLFGQENNINTVFSKRATSPCLVVSARGFEHSTFSDLPIFNSIWKTSQLDPNGLDQLNIQKTISLAFFKKYLLNQNGIQIENLAESYANISIEVYHE